MERLEAKLRDAHARIKANQGKDNHAAYQAAMESLVTQMRLMALKDAKKP